LGAALSPSISKAIVVSLIFFMPGEGRRLGAGLHRSLQQPVPYSQGSMYFFNTHMLHKGLLVSKSLLSKGSFSCTRSYLNPRGASCRSPSPAATAPAVVVLLAQRAVLDALQDVGHQRAAVPEPLPTAAG
jgi:hypothetical protein